MTVSSIVGVERKRHVIARRRSPVQGADIPDAVVVFGLVTEQTMQPGRPIAQESPGTFGPYWTGPAGATCSRRK